MATKTVDKRTDEARTFLEELVGPLTIASKLQAYRENWEISQAEMARRLGISRANLNDIEKGRKLVSAGRAAMFGEKLGQLPQHWAAVAIEDELRAEGLSYRVHLELVPGSKKHSVRSSSGGTTRVLAAKSR